MKMQIPEIKRFTALNAKTWKATDSVFHGAIYIDQLPSYEILFRDVFLKNQLCIVGPEATSNWTSLKDWVLEDGSPNFHFLMENFGETTAPVADCNAQEFSAHPKTEMTVKNFLLYWQELRLQGYPIDGKCLYLKDWHFAKYFPTYKAYRPPAFLCSDWLNEFWDVRDDIVNEDDYRFVYMGPKNSWTPFHADVLHSYSWSANICGLKKWIFFPPGSEEKLKDKYHHLTFDLRSLELYDPDKYPDAASTVENAITILQNPGEIIFIPSGWYHQVFNLEDTISINHNWVNGCSSHLSWEFIKSRLTAVQKEISDCQEMDGWDEQCQMILKADSGMDLVDFYNFLATIAEHRLQALSQYMEEVIRRDIVLDIHDKDVLTSGEQVHWTVLSDGSRCKHKHVENDVCCWYNQLHLLGKSMSSLMLVDHLSCNSKCDLVKEKEACDSNCDLVKKKEVCDSNCDLVKQKEACDSNCDLVKKKEVCDSNCDLVKQKEACDSNCDLVKKKEVCDSNCDPVKQKEVGDSNWETFKEKELCDCFKSSHVVPVYDENLKVHQDVVVSLWDGCDKDHPVSVTPLCDIKVKVECSCTLPCCDNPSHDHDCGTTVHCSHRDCGTTVHFSHHGCGTIVHYSQFCHCFHVGDIIVKSGSDNFAPGLLDHNCNIKVPTEESQCPTYLWCHVEFLTFFKTLSGDRHFGHNTEKGFKKNVLVNFETHGNNKRTNHISSFGQENISENELTDSGTPSVFLCLFHGTVVSLENIQHSESLNENKSCGSVDVNKVKARDTKEVVCPSLELHMECPHWAHCGPNLALFDLCRVVDLIREMLEQPQFKVVLEGSAHSSKLRVTPSALIDRIEQVTELMNQTPVPTVFTF